MAQIRDVAKLAGVSPATVSRAYSDPSKLSTETLKRVRAAAAELKYKPSTLAQLFREKRTNTVLVMVPDIANVLFARVVSGIERVAVENKYNLIVSDTRDDAAIEAVGVEMVETYRADGVIQLGERPLSQLHHEGEQCTIPFVQAISADPRGRYPTVGIDDRKAAAMMTDHLLSSGHRRIGMLAGLEDRLVTQERLAGFREALAARDLPLDETLVEYGAYSMAGGESAATRLLSRERNVSALFCMSDEIAIGAIRAAHDLGFKLPSDLSISGFDNIEFGKYCTPPLTTVMQPAEKIGEVAMTLMCEMLRGRSTSQIHEMLPTELVVRASVRELA
jgi:LacI family transcriptional regulator, repressor for deo operon, udp, cdd, tsx, nupC, and nupG